MAAHDPLATAVDGTACLQGAGRGAGATWAEIARETGYDWGTVKRYLSADAGSSPPAPAKRGPGPRKTDPYAHLIDAWLRAQPKLKASVIWERLVNEHGFDGHYQRVKVYVRENRERLVGDAADPVGLHRRFEVLAGAQAQVDWGDEGELQTPAGPLHTYSFHMTLSYSRDPFCCYVAAQDLGSFWDCHRRAFAHFGGVPATIVYDRTKTVVRRHVGRGQATPLHPEAVAFAAHYGFTIWLAAPGRPQTKGRVERQVELVRSHVLCGRGSFPWLRWMPPSLPGCPTGVPRCTVPTARSSPCGPSATGPPCHRCPSSRTWSASGTSVGSARTP
jgi:transposase